MDHSDLTEEREDVNKRSEVMVGNEERVEQLRYALIPLGLCVF